MKNNTERSPSKEIQEFKKRNGFSPTNALVFSGLKREIDRLKKRGETSLSIKRFSPKIFTRYSAIISRDNGQSTS